jgi:hypothetical protein
MPTGSSTSARALATLADLVADRSTLTGQYLAAYVRA